MRGSVSGRTDIELNEISLEDSTNKMAGNSMNQRLQKLGDTPL